MRGPSSEWPVPAPDQPPGLRPRLIRCPLPRRADRARPHQELQCPPPSPTSACPRPCAASSPSQGITDAVPHPGGHAARRAGRARPLRPRPDRVGQDHRLRHPPRHPHRPGRAQAAHGRWCWCPTRELAAQVRDELVMLAGPARRLASRPSTAATASTASSRPCAAASTSPSACPGRLADLIDRGDVRLDAVEVVVIDEADRMADMGFLPEVKRLLDHVPDDRQTLLFSATLDGAVDELIRRYQQRPARHELPADPDDGARVEHLFWTVARDQRIGLCAKVISLARSDHRVLPHQARRRPGRPPARGRRRARRRHPRRSVAGPARAGPGRVPARPGRRAGGHRRGRPRHPRRRRGRGRAPRSARPTRRTTSTARAAPAGPGPTGVVVSFVAPEQRKDVAKMQRTLGMPSGMTTPDATGLPRASAASAGPPQPRPSERPRGRRAATARPAGSPRPPLGRRSSMAAGRQGRTSAQAESTAVGSAGQGGGQGGPEARPTPRPSSTSAKPTARPVGPTSSPVRSAGATAAPTVTPAVDLVPTRAQRRQPSGARTR